MPSIPTGRGRLFETVGLEIEGVLMDRNEMEKDFMRKLGNLMGRLVTKVSLDRDASTESFAETLRIGDVFRKINMHTKAYSNLANRGTGNTAVYGYEYKTVPIEMKDLERVLYPLIFTLYEFGDVISDRTSIHIHTGFANNFRMLNSLLTIMLSLEPVLYRLGGMGGTFRGHLNNAAYCRPMLNSCVVPVSREGSSRYAQILNPREAIRATNIEDWWARMGIDYDASGQHKYHPSRYAGMNFFSVYSHGTAEWRYFNKSFNVPLVIAIVKLMRATVETSSFVTRRDLSRFDIIDSSQEISVGDSEGILSMVHALCHEKGADNIPTENEMALILETVSESHFSPLPSTPTNCHIKDFIISEQLVKKGNLRIVDEWLPTNYVDVHNIADTTMSIFS